MFIQLSSMLEDKNSGFLGTMGATNGSFGFPLQPIDTKTTCNQRNHPGARPGLASENTLPPKLKKKLQGPKKPKTAYNFYQLKERDIVCNEVWNNMGFDVSKTHHNAEVARIIGKRWRELPKDKKEFFQRLASEDKLRYQRELVEYEQLAQQYPQFVNANKNGSKSSSKKPASKRDISGQGRTPLASRKCNNKSPAEKRRIQPSREQFNMPNSSTETSLPLATHPNPLNASPPRASGFATNSSSISQLLESSPNMLSMQPSSNFFAPPLSLAGEDGCEWWWEKQASSQSPVFSRPTPSVSHSSLEKSTSHSSTTENQGMSLLMSIDDSLMR
uniref:HMG box domain-containing protein n=1 Tax=Amorphochlora amoebiformis TaxID=1561963 RepID=A0A7S0GPA6_9EUKA